MPSLAQIGANVNRLAPTPLVQYVVRNYMQNNQLFNLLPFVGMGAFLGSGRGLQFNATYTDEPTTAVNRSIGEEPDPDNSDLKQVTLTLKAISKVFNTDRILDRAFSAGGGTLETWREFQTKQCTDAVINKFTYDFINGDATSNVKEFDGLMKYFESHAGQIDNDALEIDVLNPTNALQVEQFLNNSISKVKGGPNLIVTTRLGGQSFLRALEGHRNRGIETIDLNGVKYDKYMGIYVIGLEDKMFKPAVLEKGIPFIFMRLDEMSDGIRVVVPATGPVVDVVIPGVGGDSNGTFTKRGGVEIVSVPVFVDPYVASMCYIKQDASKKS